MTNNGALIPAVEALRMLCVIERSFRREASAGEAAEITFGESVLRQAGVNSGELYARLKAQLDDEFGKVARLTHSAVASLVVSTKRQRDFDARGLLCDDPAWVRPYNLVGVIDALRDAIEEIVVSSAKWVGLSTDGLMNDEQRGRLVHAIRYVASLIKSKLAEARRLTEKWREPDLSRIVVIFTGA